MPRAPSRFTSSMMSATIEGELKTKAAITVTTAT